MKAWWDSHKRDGRRGADRRSRCPRVLVTHPSTDDGEGPLFPPPLVLEDSTTASANTDGPSTSSNERNSACSLESLKEEQKNTWQVEIDSSGDDDGLWMVTDPPEDSIDQGKKYSKDNPSELPITTFKEFSGDDHVSEGENENLITSEISVKDISESPGGVISFDSFCKDPSRSHIQNTELMSEVESRITSGENPEKICIVNIEGSSPSPESSLTERVDVNELLDEALNQSRSKYHIRPRSFTDCVSYRRQVSLSDARKNFRDHISTLAPTNKAEDNNYSNGYTSDRLENGNKGTTLNSKSLNSSEILKPNEQSPLEDNDSSISSNPNAIFMGVSNNKEKEVIASPNNPEIIAENGNPVGPGRADECFNEKDQCICGTKISQSLKRKSQGGLSKLQISPIPKHAGDLLTRPSLTPTNPYGLTEPQTAPITTRKSLPPMLLSPNLSPPEETSGGTSHDIRKFSFPILRRHSHTTLHRSESMASLTFRSLVSFVQEDNLQGLQNFLDSKRVAVDDRDENGTTALMVASTKGKLTFVRELLNHGAEVNLEDGDNWSALLCAAKEGHTDIVALLLDHGANLEHRDMGGWTALMWACYKGRTETAHLLLEKGADVTAHGNYHIPSLLWAAGRGHTQIVNDLLAHGAKPNVADKYGTSALLWACRKGHIEIVELLLKAGANVDTAGMYSWTPLLVATIGGYSDIVHRLLEHRPNTNAVDKDGCTALTHACRDGHMPIVVALLNAGAYINIQDRAGDTNLIHAVKGGHRGVVESLLKKYADVDIPGKDRKTATYWAVEKNNPPMLRILLTANPDLEIATKDGDTALLRAVRVRSIELVQLLLDKKAKVTAADKKGDTALHIAMRARSKGIVEVLLRNPKNSQLLYRPNRASETPYNIDISHQKTILSQIYGARRLNTSEDSEAMLGYDLYSSALADILSEPSLSLPITVGLYARWGSGKSFLLSKLREEMNNFARQWMDPVFQFSSLLFLAVCHVAMVGGAITGLAFRSWVAGVATGGGIIAVTYAILLLVWYSSQRYDWYWPYNFNVTLTRKLNTLKLVLQVMFCHPPGESWSESLQAQPIRFYFSEQTRVSNTTGGESSIVQMVASLYDAIEADYGALPTRLYRAFRPRPLRATSSWRWRRICCLPYVVVVVFTIMCSVALALCLSIYLQDMESFKDTSSTERLSLVSTMSALGAVITVAILANLGTWGRMAKALVFPHRRHLQNALRSASSLGGGSSSGDSPSLRTGGFLHALRAEVSTMTEMVRCLDGFCGQQQSRLVAVVDGLDACEQEKVLLVMDAVQVLLSQAETRQTMSPSSVANTSGGVNSQSTATPAASAPFIIILAIDPHVISRALETNLRRYGNEWGPGGGLGGITAGGTGAAAVAALGPGNVGLVGGMAYLRNIVHLPFFLQSSGPRRLRAAAALRQHGNRRRNISECIQDDHSLRRLSSESGISHTERQRLSERSSITGERLRRKGTVNRLLPSDSICSSLGSNLNRAGGATGGGGPFDLSKVLLADDYFSDVNPRSMRRLMNIVHITGRLLKAFQVDFSWYHLANWVNVTEQWPFRISFLGLHCETHSNSYDAETPLKEIYDQIRDEIPAWREMCPLVDLDREERKFDVFLSYHKASLHFADLQLFLPFTINLDPYIKKVIREEQQNMDDMGLPMVSTAQAPLIGGQWPLTVSAHQQQQHSIPPASHLPWSSKSSLVRRNRNVAGHKSNATSVIGPGNAMVYHGGQQWQSHGQVQPGWHYLPPQEAFLSPKPTPTTAFPPDLMEIRLSNLSVSGVCDLIGRLPDVTPSLVPGYQEIARENNLSGRVLLHCDLDELKKVLRMNFGDWELFRILVIALREQECVSVTQTDEIGLSSKNVRFAATRMQNKGRDEDAKASIGSSTSHHSNWSATDSKSLQSGQPVAENLSAVQFVPPVVSVTSPSSDQLLTNVHDTSSSCTGDSYSSSPHPRPVITPHHSIEISAVGSDSPVRRTSSVDNTHASTSVETGSNHESGWESKVKDLHMSQSFSSSARGSIPAVNKEEIEGDSRKYGEQRSKSGNNYSHSSSSPISLSGISSPPQGWGTRQQQQLEKQVMMEEEMICEALHALNKETLADDVLDEEDDDTDREDDDEEGGEVVVVTLNEEEEEYGVGNRRRKEEEGGRELQNSGRAGMVKEGLRSEEEKVEEKGGITSLGKKMLSCQMKTPSEKKSSFKLSDTPQDKFEHGLNITKGGEDLANNTINIPNEKKSIPHELLNIYSENSNSENEVPNNDSIDPGGNYVSLVEDSESSNTAKTSPYVPFRKAQISLASYIDGSPVSARKMSDSSSSIDKINRFKDKVMQMVTNSCTNKEGFVAIEKVTDEVKQYELPLEDEIFSINGCEGEDDESTPLVSETSTPSDWSFDNDANPGKMNHGFSVNMICYDKEYSDCSEEQRDVHSWAGEKCKGFSSSGECDSNISITPQHSSPIHTNAESTKDSFLYLGTRSCQSSTNYLTPTTSNGITQNSCSWSGRCKRKLYKKRNESHSVPRMFASSDRKKFEMSVKDEANVLSDRIYNAEKLQDGNDIPALMRVLDKRNSGQQSSALPLEEVNLTKTPENESNEVVCEILLGREEKDTAKKQCSNEKVCSNTDNIKSESSPETTV